MQESAGGFVRFVVRTAPVIDSGRTVRLFFCVFADAHMLNEFSRFVPYNSARRVPNMSQMPLRLP